MNDVVSDAESVALTHEEAIQVLRLSPEGLRRLADLDEAIMELRAARRSLLALRLDSIKDAFAAARKAQPMSGNDGEVAGRDTAAGASAGERPMNHGPGPNGVPTSPVARQDSVPASDGNGHASTNALQNELRMLRTEVAELRREVASSKGSGSGEVNLQQIQRRLSYLEAELESRHL